MLSQIPPGVKVDTIYLDTTYSKPKFTFPAQGIVIEELAQAVQPLLVEEPKTLIVVAAYHIGKEKVYLGLAQKLGIKVSLKTCMLMFKTQFANRQYRPG